MRRYSYHSLHVIGQKFTIAVTDVHSFNLTISCGQDLHRTLTHSREKGNPCLLSNFPSFCSDLYLFSKDFYPIFYPFDPCFGILLGRGSKWDQPLPIFCVKSTHLGVTSGIPMHLTYVKFLPLGTCKGTQVFLISSIYGMHRYENFATKLWKKCWKGAHFWKGIFEVPRPPDTSCRPLVEPKWLWFHQFLECIVMGT